MTSASTLYPEADIPYAKHFTFGSSRPSMNFDFTSEDDVGTDRDSVSASSSSSEDSLGVDDEIPSQALYGLPHAINIKNLVQSSLFFKPRLVYSLELSSSAKYWVYKVLDRHYISEATFFKLFLAYMDECIRNSMIEILSKVKTGWSNVYTLLNDVCDAFDATLQKLLWTFVLEMLACPLGSKPTSISFALTERVLFDDDVQYTALMYDEASISIMAVYVRYKDSVEEALANLRKFVHRFFLTQITQLAGREKRHEDMGYYQDTYDEQQLGDFEDEEAVHYDMTGSMVLKPSFFVGDDEIYA